MSSFSETPTHPSPAVPETPAGVFAADPQNPPPAPPDARAVVIRDASGAPIAFAWALGPHGDDLHDAAWTWLEDHSSPPHRPLRIVR